MKTKVGRLSQRIVIQAATLTPDGRGGNRETWADALNVWAEVLPGSSARMMDMLQNMIYTDAIFRIRSGTGIGKKNRIAYNGRAYIIEGIRDWEQDREFQYIDCRYDESTTVAPTGGGSDSTSTGIQIKELSASVGNTTIQDNALINKTMVELSRNGIALQKVASSPTGEQFVYNSVTGTITLGLAIGAGEYYQAVYYG